MTKVATMYCHSTLRAPLCMWSKAVILFAVNLLATKMPPEIMLMLKEQITLILEVCVICHHNDLAANHDNDLSASDSDAAHCHDWHVSGSGTHSHTLSVAELILVTTRGSCVIKIQATLLLKSIINICLLFADTWLTSFRLESLLNLLHSRIFLLWVMSRKRRGGDCLYSMMLRNWIIQPPVHRLSVPSAGNRTTLRLITLTSSSVTSVACLAIRNTNVTGDFANRV